MTETSNVQDKCNESPLLKAFDLIKKPADSMDDIWRSSQGAMPKNVAEGGGPYIIGSLMFFIHLVEGIHGYYDAMEAYHNEKIKQRKSRIAVGVTTCMLAGAGMGMSASYLLKSSVSTLAVSSAAMAVFPVLMPAFLCAIYTMALGRKIYTLGEAIEVEQSAKSDYLCFMKSEMTDPEQEQKLLKKYQDACQDRLDAEKQVAFGALEVLGSMLVTVSVILSSVALLGAASVATFGVLPMALAITGVVIATLSKILEHQDEKNNGCYTRKLRNLFFKSLDVATPAATSSHDVRLAPSV